MIRDTAHCGRSAAGVFPAVVDHGGMGRAAAAQAVKPLPSLVRRFTEAQPGISVAVRGGLHGVERDRHGSGRRGGGRPAGVDGGADGARGCTSRRWAGSGSCWSHRRTARSGRATWCTTRSWPGSGARVHDLEPVAHLHISLATRPDALSPTRRHLPRRGRRSVGAGPRFAVGTADSDPQRPLPAGGTAGSCRRGRPRFLPADVVPPLGGDRGTTRHRVGPLGIPATGLFARVPLIVSLSGRTSAQRHVSAAGRHVRSAQRSI